MLVRPAAPAPAQPVPTEDVAAAEVVLRLGRALHDQGAPAHRLEDAMNALSARLGLSSQIFSTPTAIFASFGVQPGTDRTVLLRVGGGTVDLGRMADLDRVALEIERGELSPADALERIDRIVASPRRWGPLLTLLCYGLNSAAASLFFGGGAAEAGAALAIGLLIGTMAHLADRARHPFRAFEPVAAFGASAAAIGLSFLFPVSAPVATLAGLIVLLPGYSLTVAVAELATRHLASGSARLTGAGLTFLTIAFGVALGVKAGAALGAPVPALPVPLPGWTEALALVVAGLSFGVVFRADARDLPFIVLAATLGYAASRTGARLLGPELGAFAGALLVASSANLYARLRERPAGVPLVPGIMLLVPGSLGFRGVTELMQSDVLSGVSLAFSAVVIAVAIVTGLLLANEIVPPRRAL